MLFGQSLFQSVLTRLDEEQADGEHEGTGETRPFRVSGLNTGFVAAVEIAMGPAQARDAYRDGMDTRSGYDEQAAGNPGTADPGPDAAPGGANAAGPDRGTPPGSGAGGRTAARERPVGRKVGAEYREPGDGPAHPITTSHTPSPEPHRHLARLLPDEVAEDLGLDASDTATTLAEKRRRFARTNHPDSVPAAFRSAANTRMTIANRLIDEARRRLPQR